MHGQAATISIDGIILNSNIKSLNSMKKLSFIGLMCFAFNTMVLAQTDYGLSIRGGVWWAKCNNPVVIGEQIAKAAFSPNFSIGIFYKQYFKSKITIETQLNYQLLLSNYSYKSFYPSSPTFNPDLSYYYMLWDDLNFPNEVLIVNGEKIYTSRIIGEEASTIKYHKIEIPLQVGYTFKKFNPYIGIKYSFKMYNLSEREVMEDDGEHVIQWGVIGTKGPNNFENCLGLTTGLNYIISDKLVVSLNYYNAFTKDYYYTGYLLDYNTEEIVSKDNYNWKSRSIEISVSYSLKIKDNNE